LRPEPPPAAEAQAAAKPLLAQIRASPPHLLRQLPRRLRLGGQVGEGAFERGTCALVVPELDLRQDVLGAHVGVPGAGRQGRRGHGARALGAAVLELERDVAGPQERPPLLAPSVAVRLAPGAPLLEQHPGSGRVAAALSPLHADPRAVDEGVVGAPGERARSTPPPRLYKGSPAERPAGVEGLEEFEAARHHRVARPVFWRRGHARCDPHAVDPKQCKDTAAGSALSILFFSINGQSALGCSVSD
jgi:hypothetical protein